MPTAPISEVDPRPAETLDARRARVERERSLVAEADADIDAGLGVEWDEVEQWLDALDQDETLPAPEAPRSGRVSGG